MNTHTQPSASDITHAPQGGLIAYPAGVLPPAALAVAPAHSVSDRYEFISTKQVIEMMASEGFEVAETAVRRKRAPGAPQLGAHVVDFRHPQAPSLFGTVPRILFMNSHDGSRRAQVRIGAFRLVCSNGMVSGLTLAQANVRHAGDAARELVERMRALSKTTLPMFQQIERWSRKDLSRAQQVEFARLAAQLRWPKAPGGAMPPEALLEVRRAGDDAGDLWTVFNRVQEATTRLSLPARAATGRPTVTKPLLEIGPSMKYNADLWQLAEEFSAH